MSLRSIALFSSAAKSVNQATTNLYNLKQKKAEKKQRDELFDLQKKKFELDLDEKEMKGEISKIEYDMMKMVSNEFKKKYKTQSDAIGNQQDSIEEGLMGQRKKAQSVVGKLLQSDPDLQSIVGGRSITDDFDLTFGSGGVGFKPKAKGTDKQNYRVDLQRFLNKKITKQQLEYMYPDMKKKIDDDVARHSPPIIPNPEFKNTKGLISSLRAPFNKNIASLSEKEFKVIQQIQTEEDLKFFLTPTYQAEMQAKGVNVEAIKEYYGIEQIDEVLQTMGDFGGLSL